MKDRVRLAVLRAAGANSVEALSEAFCGAVDLQTTALGRIWLIDQCERLRLVASTGRPIGGGSYHQINGDHAVVRDGAGKVARIALTGEPLIARGLRGDESWLENPAWIARQGIRSFVGLPMALDGRVLGVLVLFDRLLTSEETIEDLRFLADVLAVRLSSLRHGAGSIASIVTRQQLRSFEKQSIEAALEKCGGKVFGRNGAAAILGMKPTTLASRMKALGIK